MSVFLTGNVFNVDGDRSSDAVKKLNEGFFIKINLLLMHITEAI